MLIKIKYYFTFTGNKRFSPAQNAPKPTVSGIQPPMFYGTPQSTNPTALLRNNLKNKIKDKIDERVAQMPSTSPYALLEGETENGSPGYVFNKVDRVTSATKSAAKAKYITATPGLSAKPRSRRSALSSVDVNRANLIRALENEEDKNSASDYETENEENDASTSSPVASPTKRQPEVVTGSLANACNIM